MRSHANVPPNSIAMILVLDGFVYMLNILHFVYTNTGCYDYYESR